MLLLRCCKTSLNTVMGTKAHTVLLIIQLEEVAELSQPLPLKYHPPTGGNPNNNIMKTIKIDTPFNILDCWRLWAGSRHFSNLTHIGSRIRDLGTHHLLEEADFDSIDWSILADAELQYITGMARSAAFKTVGFTVNQENPFTDHFKEVKEAIRVIVKTNGSLYGTCIFRPSKP